MKSAIELTAKELLRAACDYALAHGMMPNGTYDVSMRVYSDRAIFTYEASGTSTAPPREIEGASR